jgi:hypothetical protein
VTVPRDVDENRIADGGWRTQGNVLIKDPANPRDDDDNQLPGDGYPGDGLSNYEEYRGFKVQGFFIRTSIRNKDLFIHNPAGFFLANFRAALSDPGGTGRVSVHQIEEDEYVDNNFRQINFNYNPQLHYLPVPSEPPRIQKGLRVLNGVKFEEKPSLLGFTAWEDPEFKSFNTPPNWVKAVVIFPDNIRRYSQRVGIDVEDKIIQVVSHELGHGISMWHHGETLRQKNGLQSGDVDCIMRYDNVLPFNTPEALGTIFCKDPRGTGNNALSSCEIPACYGNAAPGRGDCIHQFRISCRTVHFPVR